jgi:hypothetical protein
MAGGDPVTTAPKPLPAHGTQTRYKGAKNGSYPPCKCDLCVRAHTNACKRRALAHLAGVPPLYPAEPLRAHVQTLEDAGMSRDLIARRATVSHATISYLMRGLGKAVRREKALRILAVQAGDFDALAERPAAGSMRRVRAMYWMGHSPLAISAASGIGENTISNIANGHQEIVQTPTALAIAAAYRALSVRQGSSYKARKRARDLGWHGPMAWDSDIDDPNAVPDTDTGPSRSRIEHQPCGTTAAYRRHLRNKEPIDEACQLANRLHVAARKTTRAAA